MTKQNNGGPAFPQSDTLFEDGAELVRTAHGGMTLRDYFAGQALVGLMSQPGEHWGHQDIVDAYDIADAMLRARE